MLIVVFGVPAPQGSKRFVGLAKSGRGILIEASKKARPWRQDVKGIALEVRNGAAPLDSPLSVRMIFTMPKPASAPKKRVTLPMRKPDVDKLCRNVLDALVDAGVMIDDARVVRLEAAKVFPNEDPEALDSPGVRITIEPLEAAA